MSTTTNSERKRPRTSPQGVSQYDRFIEQQLDKTSSQVKLTDLLSAVMVLAGGVLVGLLVLAVIDHWIFGFALWGRWLALLALVAGVLGYVGLVLVPSLFRHVNPAYAARTIEQSEPSLKNSLINFLLFRADRAGLSSAVYTALQQRAAADLTKVQVEGAVDRGPLIKIGYGLAAVLAVFAVYTILSPKSPFQTFERIAAPWADIARPARVRIEQVQPGHVTVFCGDHVTVSAQIYDVREGEPVELCYSTKDGHVTAAKVALQATDGGLRYEGQLPPDPDGMQQDLVYWIVAGDATTETYRATVEPAPTIWVEQVEYDYPPYTKKPCRAVQRQGDLQGLEGTRVTLRAQANVPIRAAMIELQPNLVTSEADRDEPNAGPASSPSRTGADAGPTNKPSSHIRVLEMNAAGQTASCSFVLELDAARTRPRYASYQVRFVTQAGQRNPRPVLHRIEVTRDLSPEIEILTPTRSRVEVPEDGQQPIEARAIDPDFGLRKVTLRAASGGAEILTRVLLDDPQGRQGQALVNYVFRPRELRLAAGAEVVYGLSAEDNRTSTSTGAPEPNVTRTADYHFVILPAEKPTGFETEAAPPKPKPDPAATPERPQDEPQEATPTGDKGAKDDQQIQSKDKDASGSGGQGGEKTDKQSGGGQSGQEGQNKKGDNSGGQGSQSGQKSDSQPDDSGQTGTGTGKSSQQPGDPNAAGSPDSSGGQGGGSGNREEPLHEGEVFEKMLQRLQEQGGKPGQGQDQGESLGKPPPGESAKDTTGQGKPTGEPQESRPEPAGKDPSASDGKASDGPGKPTDQMPAEAPAGANQQQPGKPQSQGETGKPDKNLGGGPQENAKPGTGGAPEGPAETGTPKQPSDQGGEQQQPGTGTNGESGAGQPATEKQGAASPMGKNQDRQKQGNGGSGGDKPQQNPESQSPSLSNKQSDSQGPEGGDRSGGGKQGAGQGTNQAGHDSAGSNSPADEGAGAASDPGTGDTSKGAGDKQPSPDKTGATGTETGPGSSAKPGSQAGGPGDLPNSGQPGGGQSPPTYGSPDSQRPNREGPSLPMGGGVPGQGELRGANVTGEAPPEEKPKLEYTRKATDLVLEYLKDQQQKPDQQLLRDLGWTPDDLNQFIQRWQSLKRAAAESEAGRRELDESLRSLGLRPAKSSSRRGNVRDDQAGGLRDVGSQSSPPSLYLEQFNAFKKGTARTTDRDAAK